MNCEKNVPFKAQLDAYLQRQGGRVVDADVDVRLNTTVTEDAAGAFASDVIIAALGARPVTPNIPGTNAEHVHIAQDVYTNPTPASNRVVILGGGLVGTELAVYLAGMGRDVTIMEMLPQLSDGGNMVLSTL